MLYHWAQFVQATLILEMSDKVFTLRPLKPFLSNQIWNPKQFRSFLECGFMSVIEKKSVVRIAAVMCSPRTCTTFILLSYALGSVPSLFAVQILWENYRRLPEDIPHTTCLIWRRVQLGAFYFSTQKTISKYSWAMWRALVTTGEILYSHIWDCGWKSSHMALSLSVRVRLAFMSLSCIQSTCRMAS